MIDMIPEVFEKYAEINGFEVSVQADHSNHPTSSFELVDENSSTRYTIQGYFSSERATFFVTGVTSI